MGTVVAGRLQGAGYNFACSHNPVAGGAFDTISKLNGGVLLLGCGSLGRTNNSVAYVSPNWSGFTFEYNHARVTENANRAFVGTAVPAGAAAASPFTINSAANAAGSDPAFSTDDSYANLLRGNYTNGPFSASLVWASLEGGKNAAGTLAAVQPVDTKEWGIGADYDFGIAKIYGTYQDRDTDKTSLGAVSTANGDKYALGVSIPVFKVGSIMLSYADFDAEVKGWDADAWTLAYFHSLSKRTTLYGGYSSVSNDRLNGSTAAAASAAPRTGGDASMLAFGMRHTF
jgi:predicted porin